MFLKTTLAAAALTIMVSAPAFASSADAAFGIDDRYSLKTEWDLPQAQAPQPIAMQEEVTPAPRVHHHTNRVARQERHLNRQDQMGR